MLTKDFNQNEKRYCIKMWDQEYYALSELMQMTVEFLRRMFAVRDLSLAEGVILRRCVEAAATARERDLRGEGKIWMAR